MQWRSNIVLGLLVDGPRCDGCVAAYLGTRESKANTAVQRWVRRGGATRKRAKCPGCGAERLVTSLVLEKWVGRPRYN